MGSLYPFPLSSKRSEWTKEKGEKKKKREEEKREKKNAFLSLLALYFVRTGTLAKKPGRKRKKEKKRKRERGEGEGGGGSFPHLPVPFLQFNVPEEGKKERDKLPEDRGAPPSYN